MRVLVAIVLGLLLSGAEAQCDTASAAMGTKVIGIAAVADLDFNLLNDCYSGLDPTNFENCFAVPECYPDCDDDTVYNWNYEETDGLRTDSPAGDVDAHNIVFSWCAAHKVRIKSADISNTSLHGKEVDRIILYKIPKGGIPERDIPEGTVLAARVPIYGRRMDTRCRKRFLAQAQGRDACQRLRA